MTQPVRTWPPPGPHPPMAVPQKPWPDDWTPEAEILGPWIAYLDEVGVAHDDDGQVLVDDDGNARRAQ